MNIVSIEKLQPELYAAIVERGVAIERTRVLVHLKVAKYYHSLYESIAEIEAGTPVDETYPYLNLHDYYCTKEDSRCD